jgi:hypothetical protein
MKLTLDFAIFGLAIGFSALLCFLLARWYVWPRVAARPRREALILLMWPHTCRFLNLAAATASQTDPRLAHPWILEVAWGDFVAAVLALGAIAALRAKSSAAIGLTWVATLFGLADFINSLGQGVMNGAADLPLRAVWYIAAGLVPPLFTLHVLAILRLRAPEKA